MKDFAAALNDPDPQARDLKIDVIAKDLSVADKLALFATRRQPTDTPDRDELLPIEGFEHVFMRAPASLDHSPAARFLRAAGLAPFLARPVDGSKLRLAIFEDDRPTREFANSLPKKALARDGGLELIMRGEDPADHLLSAFAGKTLVIVAHVVEGNSLQLPRSPDGRPGGTVDIASLQAAAKAQGVQLVVLGCATGGIAAVGTSGEISSMDAVKNFKSALGEDVRTIGDLMNRLADGAYDIHIRWDAAPDAHKALEPDARGVETDQPVTVPFEFVPRGIPPAASAGPSPSAPAGSAPSWVQLSNAAEPSVPFAPINPAAFHQSKTFSHIARLLVVPATLVGSLAMYFGFVMAVVVVPLSLYSWLMGVPDLGQITFGGMVRAVGLFLVLGAIGAGLLGLVHYSYESLVVASIDTTLLVALASLPAALFSVKTSESEPPMETPVRVIVGVLIVLFWLLAFLLLPTGPLRFARDLGEHMGWIDARFLSLNS